MHLPGSQNYWSLRWDLIIQKLDLYKNVEDHRRKNGRPQI